MPSSVPQSLNSSTNEPVKVAVSSCPVNDVCFRLQSPIPHSSLPIADPHIFDLNYDDVNIPTGNKIGSPSTPITVDPCAGVLAEELGTLRVRVVLEMAIAKVLLLFGAWLCYPCHASYGGADAGNLRRVEVEEEGREAGRGFGNGGAAGGAAGVRGRPVGDPCV